MIRIIYLIGLMIFIACSHHKTVKAVNYKCKDDNKKFNKEVTGSWDKILLKDSGKVYNDYIKQTGFKDLRKGFDGFYLQIREPKFTDNKNNYFILVFENNNWTAHLKTIQFLGNDSIYNVVSSKKFTTPKSGWYNFVNKFLEYNLLTMPDCLKILNYKIAHNSSSYCFEIADCKNYRMFTYNMPFENSENVKEAKIIYDLISLIENEFNFKFDNDVN